MKKAILIGIMAMFVLAAGCVTRSINGIATENNIVFDENLLGIWGEADGDSVVMITDAGENTYTFGGKDENGEVYGLPVHLCRMGDYLFLDMSPKESDIKGNIMLSIHLLPTHTFYLVDQIQPTLKLKMISDSRLQEYLAAHPGKIAYTIVDGNVVLTDSTENIQAFLVELAGIKDAFEPADDLYRMD
nr:hypothetical protein [candidate division Zixibacteria bacterium]